MEGGGIVFVGDVHRRWDHVAQGLAALPAPPHAVVLLGDMECHRPLDELVAPMLDAGIGLHWICGNHDYDGGPAMWRNLSAPELNPRTHALCLNGMVREIGGLRIGGLSGTFRSRVWLPPAEPRLTRRGEMAEDCLTIGPGWSEAQCLAMGEALEAMAIWPEDAEALVRQGCEVLVTHEAPSSHPMGFVALDALARAAGARLIVHGHHHCNYRRRAADGLLVQGVGAGWGVGLDGKAWWPGEAERWLAAAEGEWKGRALMRIDDLAGKKVLVTGASTGIGAAVARGFAAQGAHVAVHCNASRPAAEDVVAGIKAAGGTALVLQADVRSMEACAALVQEAHGMLGGLDVLVNNAGGVVQRKALRDIDDALFHDIVHLNARSVFACSRAALPLLEQAGGGVIISTTSLAARNGGGSQSTLYAASKAFVSNFTRGLAKEVGRRGIRVNAVAPGVIGKPDRLKTMPAHQMEGAIKLTPMRRIGTVDECVGAYLFLASNSMAGFVTGQIIEVNGGLQMP